METPNINNLMEELTVLRNKAKLLGTIMSYYNDETLTFDVPDQWRKGVKLSDEMKKRTPKSPRHALAQDIIKLLPADEQGHFDLEHSYATIL